MEKKADWSMVHVGTCVLDKAQEQSVLDAVDH
jgi:hypothetical protein